MKLSRLLFASALIIFCGTALLWLFGAGTFEEKEDEKYEDYFKSHYRIFALNLPQKLDFAGEKVPLQLVDISERLDREILVNTYWQSQTLLLIKRSHRWFPVISEILKKNEVPDDFKYLALIESGLTNVVSPAGATGYWQLMKSAAQENGLEVRSEIDERYHVEKSTEAACLYLKEAKEKFGSWTLAAASYNMGMAGLEKQMSRQKATNYYDLLLNEETSRYMFRILAAKIILQQPQEFGFNFRNKDLYYPIKYREIEVDTSISDLADFALDQGVNYKVLKYLNPWLRDGFINNRSGKVYSIKIPEEEYIAKLVNDMEPIEASRQAEGNN